MRKGSSKQVFSVRFKDYKLNPDTFKLEKRGTCFKMYKVFTRLKQELYWVFITENCKIKNAHPIQKRCNSLHVMKQNLMC